MTLTETTKGGNYLVAYRFAEQALIQLDRIDTPLSREIAIKLKQVTRELEDILYGNPRNTQQH